LIDLFFELKVEKYRTYLGVGDLKVLAYLFTSSRHRKNNNAGAFPQCFYSDIKSLAQEKHNYKISFITDVIFKRTAWQNF